MTERINMKKDLITKMLLVTATPLFLAYTSVYAASPVSPMQPEIGAFQPGPQYVQNPSLFPKDENTQQDGINVNSQEFGLAGPLSFTTAYSSTYGFILTSKYAQELGESNAIAIEADAGKNENRLNGTWGFALTNKSRMKVTGEYLWQQMNFGFDSGSVNKWVGQQAYGAEYDYLISKGFVQDFNLNLDYSQAQSKDLGEQDFQQNGTTWENFRHIAGGRDESASAGFHVAPFHRTLVGIQLNYDNLDYNTEYQNNQNVSGFGTTLSLQQLVTDHIKLQLTSSQRKPEQSYQAELDYLAHTVPGTQLQLGLTGSHNVGAGTLPTDNRIGLNLAYTWGGSTHDHPAAYTDFVNKSEVDSHADLAGYASAPAVRRDQVFAVADQKSVEKDDARHLFNGVASNDFTPNPASEAALSAPLAKLTQGQAIQTLGLGKLIGTGDVADHLMSSLHYANIYDINVDASTSGIYRVGTDGSVTFENSGLQITGGGSKKSQPDQYSAQGSLAGTPTITSSSQAKDYLVVCLTGDATIGSSSIALHSCQNFDGKQTDYNKIFSGAFVVPVTIQNGAPEFNNGSYSVPTTLTTGAPFTATIPASAVKNGQAFIIQKDPKHPTQELNFNITNPTISSQTPIIQYIGDQSLVTKDPGNKTVTLYVEVCDFTNQSQSGCTTGQTIVIPVQDGAPGFTGYTSTDKLTTGVAYHTTVPATAVKLAPGATGFILTKSTKTPGFDFTIDNAGTGINYTSGTVTSTNNQSTIYVNVCDSVDATQCTNDQPIIIPIEHGAPKFTNNPYTTSDVLTTGVAYHTTVPATAVKLAPGATGFILTKSTKTQGFDFTIDNAGTGINYTSGTVTSTNNQSTIYVNVCDSVDTTQCTNDQPIIIPIEHGAPKFTNNPYTTSDVLTRGSDYHTTIPASAVQLAPSATGFILEKSADSKVTQGFNFNIDNAGTGITYSHTDAVTDHNNPATIYVKVCDSINTSNCTDDQKILVPINNGAPHFTKSNINLPANDELVVGPHGAVWMGSSVKGSGLDITSQNIVVDSDNKPLQQFMLKQIPGEENSNFLINAHNQIMPANANISPGQQTINLEVCSVDGKYCSANSSAENSVSTYSSLSLVAPVAAAIAPTPTSSNTDIAINVNSPQGKTIDLSQLFSNMGTPRAALSVNVGAIQFTRPDGTSAAVPADLTFTTDISNTQLTISAPPADAVGKYVIQVTASNTITDVTTTTITLYVQQAPTAITQPEISLQTWSSASYTVFKPGYSKVDTTYSVDASGLQCPDAGLTTRPQFAVSNGSLTVTLPTGIASYCKGFVAITAANSVGSAINPVHFTMITNTVPHFKQGVSVPSEFDSPVNLNVNNYFNGATSYRAVGDSLQGDFCYISLDGTVSGKGVCLVEAINNLGGSDSYSHNILNIHFS
jgi:hypothetical protein